MRGIEHSTGHDGASADGESARPGALPFDPARYRADLAVFDLTDAQQQELLATLWSIMRSFVELGFSVDVCTALLGDLDPAIPVADELR